MFGPGIGGLELVVIAIVALLVVGPKDLPVLMRQVGKLMGKARRMADEFRASFDEMARQSELDELRKEVDALRNAQPLRAVEDGTKQHFKAIDDALSPRAYAGPSPYWSDEEADAMMPLAPVDADALPELAAEPVPAPPPADEASPAMSPVPRRKPRAAKPRPKTS